MKTTIEQALRWNLTIGAHPGYPDRENFGRLEMDLPLHEIEETVLAQIRALVEIGADDQRFAVLMEAEEEDAAHAESRSAVGRAFFYVVQ